MKKTFVILLMLTFSIGICQSKIDCEKILSQKIDLSFSNKNELEKLNNTFAKLTDCGIEQIDVDTFANGPILATLLIPMVTEKGEDLTYQDLLNKILEFKKTPEYDKMIEMVKVSNDLSERKADLSNWRKDKELFEKLEIPEKTIEEFHMFLKENADPKKTYKQVFEEYKAQKKKFEPPLIVEEQFSELFDNPGLLNYSDVLAKAKELDKQIILYFNGYACVNARKIEQYVLRDNKIAKKLTMDFIFVNVYVDDKKAIPKEDWIIDSQTGKTIKTVGMKNSKFQIDNFQNNLCPYFVILDKNGQKIKERGYTREIKEFEEFLNIAE